MGDFAEEKRPSGKTRAGRVEMYKKVLKHFVLNRLATRHGWRKGRAAHSRVFRGEHEPCRQKESAWHI